MNEMNLLLNVVVLAFEVLYYALFMKFARKEGKFWKYLVTFIVATISILLLGKFEMLTYLSFIIFSIIFMKYVFKFKASFYDIFVILIMLLLKLIIEFIITLSLYFIFKNIYNIFIGAIIVSIIKIAFLFILKPKMNKIYIKLNRLWNNNNFYIRYITSVLILLYVIAVCILLIVKLI